MTTSSWSSDPQTPTCIPQLVHYKGEYHVTLCVLESIGRFRIHYPRQQPRHNHSLWSYVQRRRWSLRRLIHCFIATEASFMLASVGLIHRQSPLWLVLLRPVLLDVHSSGK